MIVNARFPRLYQRQTGREWDRALRRAGLVGARPVIHDLRHTHASRLIALGWDPGEIAKRLGDRVETILGTYVHEFDARRRSAERRAALEGLYGAKPPGMATGMSTSERRTVPTEFQEIQHLRAVDEPDERCGYAAIIGSLKRAVGYRSVGDRTRRPRGPSRLARERGSQAARQWAVVDGRTPDHGNSLGHESAGGAVRARGLRRVHIVSKQP